MFDDHRPQALPAGVRVVDPPVRVAGEEPQRAIGESEQRMRAHVADAVSASEQRMRTHFDVVAESLRDDIRLVAEAVAALSERQR